MRPVHHLVGAVAAWLILFSCASASAAAVQPPVATIDAATVAALVDISETYWTPNPCAGRTQVHTATRGDAIAAGARPDVIGYAAGIASAYWQPPSCAVWVIPEARPGWSVRTLCALLVHEIGHDIGYQHSLDPADVMYPILNDAAPAICDQAAATLLPPTPSRPVEDDTADTPIIAEPELAPTPPSTWPTARIVRVVHDGVGRLAFRLANPISPRLVVRFYRKTPGIDFQGRLLKRTRVRVDPTAFEAGAPNVIVAAPRTWDWATVRLTGGGRKPSTERLLPARRSQRPVHARLR
jgi:hypothetical protein